MPDAEEPQYIGTREASKVLKRHRKQVIRWIESGRLTAVTKLDGQTGAYVLMRAEVEALAAELQAKELAS